MKNEIAIEDKKEFPVVLISLFGLDFGIRHISSFLKEKGYSTLMIHFNQLRFTVELLDNDYFTSHGLAHEICPAEDLKLLISLLKKLNPRIVGISVSSVTMRAAAKITLEIKRNIETLIVWGGIHAILAPEECIPYADIVCVGEGEYPMWELVEQLRKKQTWAGIKNLWIRNNEYIEKNELMPLIEDLDTLPFPDFIQDGNEILIDSGKLGESHHILSAGSKNIYPIMTSRGCMFNCSYCCNSAIRQRYKDKGSYLRRRSVDSIIEELKCAIRYKPLSSIQFWDDLFMYDKAWIEQFCNRYVSEIGKPFICYAHPAHTDREILTKLAESGLVCVWVGIQSGSESISRDFFSRMQSNQSILDFAYKLKDLKITAKYDLISDNPYETEREQRDTLDLLLALPHPYRCVIYSLCYFPKTPLTERALKDGLIKTENLEQYTSKALNNFHMYLKLSRTQGYLFWNCIKAMAVNKHFPKFIVRLCGKIKFLKLCPELLVLACRFYLLLFKPIGKEKPVISAITIFRNKVTDRSIISEKSGFLFVRDRINFMFFPTDDAVNDKRFCLRINNRLEKDLFLRLLIKILPLKATSNSNRAEWGEIRCEIKAGCLTDVYLHLAYPDLYFICSGSRKKLKLIRKAEFKSQDKRLYVMVIFTRFPLMAGYRQVSRILCNI